MTSRRSNGPETAPLFSPQECPVSQPAVPGSNEARMMTAGSGRKLSALLTKPGPGGAFLKTLLESKTWASTEYLLTWKANGIKSSRRWKFQLAPSTPRTSGQGFGSWRTVTSSDAERGPHPCPDVKAGEHSLVTQIQAASWGTPQAQDAKHATLSPAEMKRNPGNMRIQAQKATWPTPLNGMGENSHGQVSGQWRDAMKSAWPSPDASEAGKTSRSGERKEELLIGGIVRGSWPTPASRDTKSEECSEEYQQERNAETRGKPLSWALRHGSATNGYPVPTVSFAVRLMTLSAWLMGYPVSYFQGLEIPSSRKSRLRSSKP